MSMRTVELVSEWDTVPFDGGYAGLRSLSDRGFSGAVTAGPTQLFMLNGTVVGILDGDIEAFDGADGTARTAPHDALPLLVVMQDQAGEPRAQYYTEDTPISDVDRTLEDGNFTGYVELSENVLSGDYYLVYHQGRSMSVAWVGNSQRLVTDEEAFEQADGEVGIYKVMPASVEPIEIPEPSSPADDAADTTAETAAGTAAADDEPADDGVGAETSQSVTSDETAESRVDSTPRSDGTEDVAGDRATPDEPVGSEPGETSERGRSAAGPPGSKAAGASQGTAVDRQQRDETAAREGESGSTSEAAAAGTDGTAIPATESTEPTTSEPGTDEPTTEDTTVAGETEPAEPAERTAAQSKSTEPRANSGTTESRTDRSAGPAATTEGSADSQAAAAAADSDAVGTLETRSIPSLDPERSSSTPEPTTATQTAEQQQPTASGSSESTQPSTTQTDGSESQASAVAEPEQSRSVPADEGQSEPSPELEVKLEERVEEIAKLEGEIRDLSTENEELAAERDRLRDELEEARAEIQRLEEELAAAGGPAPSGRALSAAEAIDGTNLFVRYHSKGEATLAKAQEGSADRASVEENLRLEYHTQFDAADAAVDGEPFEDFLHDSIHYRFADWLVRNLIYEIRDTGHESEMGVLYDALPDIDRAELNGQVSVTYTEDGQEHRSQETFDVVVRDRMGNPLVVANINDSRQPATDGQMTDIVRNAERVGNASNSLAGAFLVTSSFFEPEALETAKEATSSGLFSRDKRKSFVNLSRKSGYHLCLLEARNKEFHLAVPEL
ncbi:DUF7527 domain-containing protein [Haloarcula sediminis]|uniref:DUF7527 domain-containing protein n=1 Tax=Haloarcula sediminis TaxID=3111777 RepID=UPI002D7A2356|nr:hypothetical protein [Haloarcula sp. CK38]